MEEWDITMHEILAKEDIDDETLQQFMELLGGDFIDKVGLVKALGVY